MRGILSIVNKKCLMILFNYYIQYYLIIIHNCATFRIIKRSTRKVYYYLHFPLFSNGATESNNSFFHILLTFHILSNTIW